MNSFVLLVFGDFHRSMYALAAIHDGHGRAGKSFCIGDLYGRFMHTKN